MGRSAVLGTLGLFATMFAGGCASILGADFDRPGAGSQTGADGGRTTLAPDGAPIVSVPVGVEDFTASYAHALCDDLGRCCGDNGLGFDPNACLTVARGRAQEEYVNPGKVLGLPYDAKAAGECVASTRERTLSCGPPASTPQALRNDPCERIYSGAKKLGETCAESNECAAPLDGMSYCLDSYVTEADGGRTQVQRCTVFKAASVGDSCDYTTASSPSIGVCEEGFSALRCDPATKTCQPARPLGATCTTKTCTDGAFCNSTVSPTRCEPKRTAGQPCSDGECAPRLYCERSTKTCAPLKPTGAACVSSTECASFDCQGTKCLANVQGQPDLCGAGPKGQ